jgi:hypothetical protein
MVTIFNIDSISRQQILGFLVERNGAKRRIEIQVRSSQRGEVSKRWSELPIFSDQTLN